MADGRREVALQPFIHGMVNQMGLRMMRDRPSCRFPPFPSHDDRRHPDTAFQNGEAGSCDSFICFSSDVRAFAVVCWRYGSSRHSGTRTDMARHRCLLAVGVGIMMSVSGKPRLRRSIDDPVTRTDGPTRPAAGAAAAC